MLSFPKKKFLRGSLMENNTKPIVEGGLLTAISVILGLAATYLPIFGIAIEFFCAVPFVVLTVRQGAGKSLTALVVSFVLLAMFMGPLLAARIALTLNICGIILGYCVSRGLNAIKTFLTTFVAAFVAQAVGVAFVFFVMGINLTETELAMMRETFEETFKMYESMGVEQSTLDEMKSQLLPTLQLMSYLMPIILLLMALINTTTCYITAKLVFQKLRLKFVEPLPPFSEWRFPVIFLYLAAFSILGIYWGETRGWTLLYLVSINASIFSMLAGLIQGFAILSCAADKYNISKFSRRIIFAIIILSFSMSQILSFVGLFDMVFDYRKKFFS